MCIRDSLQNEKLTLHTARGKDLWFHVKNAPGSHTVVMSEGKDIPLATQNEAAQLAVLHSSLAGGVKVPVDYTFVKNKMCIRDRLPAARHLRPRRGGGQSGPCLR